MVGFSRREKGPVPFAPDEASPLETNSPNHGNILAMMAESGNHEEPVLHGEPIDEDHALASTLPLDRSVVAESGHMDHHRKPIVSIHGKDVDEHELNQRDAA